MGIENKTAIFYITDNGFTLAQKLNGLYPDARILKFKSEALPDAWNEHKALIFIMAAGIVVRTVAPLIKDKKTDPAVIVLDEKGKFAISLLSGHLGGANGMAREVADFLGGEAVITTASDVNNMPSIDLWAKENNLVIENWELVPSISTKLLHTGALRVYKEMTSYMKLPEEFIEVTESGDADILITHHDLKFKIQDSKLYLRPKNLIIGIGCNSMTSAEEIEDVVRGTLEENNLSFLSIHSLATIDKKGKEPGLIEFAEKYCFKVNTFTADELNLIVLSHQPSTIRPSKAAFKAVGAIAVAEPAAILASGAKKLLIKKQKMGNVTVAIAEQQSSRPAEQQDNPLSPLTKGELKGVVSPLLRGKDTTALLRYCAAAQNKGKIYIVGTGPGSIEHITPYAQDAIRMSDVIVGYGTYIDLIQELIKDKEVVSTGMTQEVDRCTKAVELALSGKTVSVISGGDPGIYAMAGLVFEILKGHGSWVRGHGKIEVIPGISALNACAARLGAPLMHDFAAISLSDRLTPWELIEKRLTAAAMSDFVTVLYNPKSVGRPEHINKARAIFLKYRSTETPVGIVKGATRENESITITNLRDLLNYDIDMQTTVIIGNSRTFVFDNWMITPRGYESKINKL